MTDQEPATPGTAARCEKLEEALRTLLRAIEGEGHGDGCSAYSMMQYDPTQCDCFKFAALRAARKLDEPQASAAQPPPETPAPPSDSKG